MIGRVGLGVLEIGRFEDVHSGKELFDATCEQRVEVEQVADVFLDRPFVVGTPAEIDARQRDLRTDSRQQAPQPLDDHRVKLGGQSELEFSVEPAHRPIVACEREDPTTSIWPEGGVELGSTRDDLAREDPDVPSSSLLVEVVLEDSRGG